MTAALLSRPLERLLDRFGTRPVEAAVETAARIGYLARAAVYASVGAMALLAAFSLTPSAKGAVAALEAWRDWPLGVALLWLIGIGLYAFAGWRLLAGAFDLEDCGGSAKGLVCRLGQAASAFTYGGLAVSTFGVLDTLEDLGEADDQAATRQAVDQALAMPFGDLLVIAAGLLVLGCAVADLVRAAVERFGKRLDSDRKTRAWAVALARYGYGARGVALAPIGVLLVIAGLNARASEARGLGGALQMLEQAPFGQVILALTGLGLIAFGAFAVAEALLLRLNVRLPTPA
jgi:hypothetical protein